MIVDVFNIEGLKSGTVELPDSIFGIAPHEHAMYLAVKAYLAHQRQGTHKTKGRSEVSGGGKKPWRQKGRGTARAGTIRSPLWVGGGNIHGPKPHKYSIDIPRKVKRLARKSALSLRAIENSIIVVEDINVSEINTKQIVTILKALNLYGQKVLHLLPKSNDTIYLSSRNIKNLKTDVADKISTYDILSHKKILLYKSAVDTIVNTF